MPHTLLLAEPRGFCAGVVRAIDVLNDVLDREPPPVYAFHEIVHNRHVVEGFRQRGAVFVNSLDEVPEGARIVFSAHGVSPEVVAEARRRSLRVIDATCPLVTKVHLETKKAELWRKLTGGDPRRQVRHRHLDEKEHDDLHDERELIQCNDRWFRYSGRRAVLSERLDCLAEWHDRPHACSE